MAAALVAMTCQVTIGRPAYAASEPLMRDALARAERLRAAAFALVREDGDAYREVLKAFRLPRASDEEGRSRQSAIEEAMIGAAEVPLKVAEIGASLIAIADEIREGANRNAHGDLDGARDAARSAIITSVRNARINLDEVASHPRKEAMLAALAACMEAAA